MNTHGVTPPRPQEGASTQQGGRPLSRTITRGGTAPVAPELKPPKRSPWALTPGLRRRLQIEATGTMRSQLWEPPSPALLTRAATR